MTTLIIGLFIVAALLSIPIAHSLVLASVAGLLIIDRVPVHLAVEQMITQTQSFPLIAIPFFMMTGALMVSGKLGQSLVSLLTMIIGRVHGGPAQVGVLSSTIFGGVSGSAVADASAIGSMLIPWLKKLGYPAPFAAGTLAAAATIDILIPPSIPMIVYALVSGASIGALFVAGILPGLLMCAGFMLVCYVQGRRRNFPRDTTAFEWGAFMRQLMHSGPALAMPVLIIIFLRFGIATPTDGSRGTGRPKPPPGSGGGRPTAACRCGRPRGRRGASAGRSPGRWCRCPAPTRRAGRPGRSRTPAPAAPCATGCCAAPG